MNFKKNANVELIKIKALIKKKVTSSIEELNEGHVMTETDFMKVCQMLSKEQYYNITDERSLYEVCGYPLCSSPIPKPKTSKLFILTKYHALQSCERGRFCSDNCYFSSHFLMDQMEIEPAWNLLGKPPKMIKFFHNLNATDRTCFKLASAVGLNDKYSKEEILDMLKTKQLKLTEKTHENTENSDSKETNSQKLCDEFKSVSINSPNEDLLINTNLQNVDLLEGKKVVENHHGDGIHVEKIKVQPMKFQQVEDLPRFEKIQKCLKEWTLKMNYYDCAKKSKQPEEVSEERIEILSIVDCSNVMVLRKGIVKEMLQLAFMTLPNGLSRVAAKALEQFNELIGYLEFSNTNILLDNDEWKVVALVLMKVFSSKDGYIMKMTHGPEYKAAIENLHMTNDQIDDITDDLLRNYRLYVLRDDN